MISNFQKPIDSGFHAKSNSNDIVQNIDLVGKKAIITGGYSGIGLETTKSLVDVGAEVFIPAKRTDEASSNLEGIVPKDHIIKMDLSDLNSVMSFADSFKESNNKLDLLINNAGIMACPETRIGKNWESQFAVNHVGHFLLTKELMHLMSNVEGARFISLSSSAHSLTPVSYTHLTLPTKRIV